MLMTDLFRALLSDPHIKPAGRRGQRQKGVDIIGRRDGAKGAIVGIQCKLKGPSKKLTEREVRQEVREALKFTPRLKEYFIVTTADEDINFDSLALMLEEATRKKGRIIRISVWGWRTLEHRIKQYDDVMERFDPGYSPAISTVKRQVGEVLSQQRNNTAAVEKLAERLDHAASGQNAKLPRVWADRELKSRLLLTLKRRGFPEADWRSEITALAESALSGILSLASDALRIEVLRRASRANASKRHVEVARQYDRAVGELGGEDDPVYEALIIDAEGDWKRSFQLLREASTPDALNAALIVLGREKGEDAVFSWLAEEGIKVGQINEAGATHVLAKKLERGVIDEALADITALPHEYYELSPALYLIKGHLILSSVLPADQKGAILTGLGLNPRSIEIASDAASRAMIKSARREFGEMLAQSKELGLPQLGESLAEIDRWLKLEDPETRDQALQELKADLADPAKTLKNVRLALAYRVDFNRAALERQLKARKDIAGWTPEEAFAALLLAYYTSDRGKTAAFFEENRQELFGDAAYFNIQVLAGIEIESLTMAGRLDDARERLAWAEGKLTAHQVQQLRDLIEGAEKGDELERFKTQYERDPDLATLRIIVGLARERNDHRTIAEFAPPLARATKQAGDFRLALTGLYSEREFERVIALCDELPELFVLDNEFASIKAWSLFQVGRLVEARELARAVYGKRGNQNDRELAVNTAIETGDWGYLQSLVSQQLDEINELDAESLIRMARIAFEVGSPYVDKFMAAAMNRFPDNPNVFLAAYSMSVERGLEVSDAQSHIWFQKALALSGKDGPVQAVSLKDLREHSKGWSRQVENVSRLIGDAQIPIYAAATALRRQPADMFIGQAIRNRIQTDPNAQGAILAFSGRRGIADLSDKRRVAIEPTALFTLQYLDLLGPALQAFERVVLAPSTLSNLFVQRQFLRVHQPSAAKKARRIVDLIASRKLTVLSKLPEGPVRLQQEVGEETAGMIAAAEEIGGLVVESWPVHRVGSLLEDQADLTGHETSLTDTHAVLAHLVRIGLLEDATRGNAESYLRHVDKGHPAAPAIDRGKRLYLDSLAVTYLDHAGLLEPLAGAVEAIFVPPSVEREARDVLLWSEQSSDTIAQLEEIASKLRTAIDEGKVDFTWHRWKDGSGEEPDADLGKFPFFELLSGLSAFDAVVTDDRCLNKEPTWSHGGKVVSSATTLDVLAFLRASGAISQDQHWHALHKLRLGGFCLVPIGTEELIARLTTASVGSDGVIEVPELRAIRESITLPQRANIYRFDEQPWLTSVRYATSQAIRQLWSLKPPSPQLEDRADWLLLISPDPVAWCGDPSNEAIWALSVRQSVGQLGLMGFLAAGDSAHRIRYREWLDKRVFDRLENEYPWLLREVAEFSKAYVRELTKEASDES